MSKRPVQPQGAAQGTYYNSQARGCERGCCCKHRVAGDWDQLPNWPRWFNHCSRTARAHEYAQAHTAHTPTHNTHTHIHTPAHPHTTPHIYTHTQHTHIYTARNICIYVYTHACAVGAGGRGVPPPTHPTPTRRLAGGDPAPHPQKSGRTFQTFTL